MIRMHYVCIGSFLAVLGPSFLINNVKAASLESACIDQTAQSCQCARHTSCADCAAADSCGWDTAVKACRERGYFHWGLVTAPDQCSCHKCRTWHAAEMTDTAWIDDLNAMFPCPCHVDVGYVYLTPTDQPPEAWTTDMTCLNYGLPRCDVYHPTAHGCLRSATNTPSGARQQCCYSAQGDLLPSGHPGEGTPDKAGTYWRHLEVDVQPFLWCCQECEDSSCGLYMEARKGDFSHCGAG